MNEAFQFAEMGRLENGRKMKEWFEGRKLPESPFKLNSCTTVIDGEGFVKKQLGDLERFEERAKKGFTRLYDLAYMRLYELKKIIENAHH